MLDYHATPRPLVEAMLEAVSGTEFDAILDPAAGDGRLLRAGQALFPAASICAVDVDPARTESLIADHPDWRVRTADYLTREPAKSPRRLGERCLVLMNPPFSSRGARKWVAGDSALNCSRAMAFLVAAVEEVGKSGEVIALMPTGCLTNTRDESARERLNAAGALTIVRKNGPHAFPGVRTRTSLVRWTSEPRARLGKSSNPGRSGFMGPVWVTRGALPVHLARRQSVEIGGTEFLHTRAASRPPLHPPVQRVMPRACERLISGPSVLLPRVGAPAPGRLGFHEADSYVLSDCLIALQRASRAETVELFDLILRNWHQLDSVYGGTCAPFLRVSDLRTVLAKLGFEYEAGPRPREAVVSCASNSLAAAQS